MGYRSVGYRSVARFSLPAARGLLPAALCPLPSARYTTHTMDCNCRLSL